MPNSKHRTTRLERILDGKIRLEPYGRRTKIARKAEQFPRQGSQAAHREMRERAARSLKMSIAVYRIWAKQTAVGPWEPPF